MRILIATLWCVGAVAQEFQPLSASVARVVETLAMIGEPLPQADLTRLRNARTVADITTVLDPHCLALIEINPEARVKVTQGPAKPELVQNGWRSFLVKVQNRAGITAVLNIESPNAGNVWNRPDFATPVRFLELNPIRTPPMKPYLSGLDLEYRILQVSSRDAGKREAKLIFDVGAGAGDVGFRNEMDVLFTIRPASKVTFRVTDENGNPTVGSFVIRDEKNRIYPSQLKRLAPDFFFQQQVYRRDGEDVLLPSGEYTVEYTRGPEYLVKSAKLRVPGGPVTFTAKLERWIDPSKLGWISGDHHIHAAGCSHYEKPTEGVYPQDMMRHILGEDLKIGSVLTWGPGWYFQKTFFEGKDHDLSTPGNRMHYDVEVSGFPSSHTGHIVLLGLSEQEYPGTRRIEEWPSWGLPVFRWAKKQGAITGFAHSGWGLKIADTQLPSLEMPPFDGIGANEYIVGVTHGLVDFISAVDTPYHWELNIWYHTLNAGYRTKISGETDFPCIYDERVGLGRSYVKQRRAYDYSDWIEGIRDGRSYVSEGKSHLIDFEVNGTPAGGEIKLDKPGRISARLSVGAYLNPSGGEAIRGRRPDDKPYWDVERARIANTRTVPVELIVNGRAVARQTVVADGKLRTIAFDAEIERSSWVAVRILPSSHTNPVFVVVNDKPIRASRESIEWCLKAVDVCWNQKKDGIRASERIEALAAYEHARREYRTRLQEVQP